MKRPPTLEDVAGLAKVSTATVSRCLNAPERVRPETRARVEAAIGQLGYTPHFGGRALASNRTGTVGAVIPTMENAIFARGLQALQEQLATAGVTLLVASSGYDPDREYSQIRALVGRGVDGLMLIGSARPPDTDRFLTDRGLPVVLAWCSEPQAPHLTVGFDNRAAAAAMAREVLAFGHSRVAMIAGRTAGNDRAAGRVAGVREALAGEGLSLEPHRLVETVYEVPAAAAVARDMLTGPDRPTAILCGNDVQAAGALFAATALGLAVPGAVSVIGFDDIELAGLMTPPLTTVHVPHRRMGQAAARLLLALGRGEEDVTGVRFDTHIVHRGSLGRPS